MATASPDRRTRRAPTRRRRGALASVAAAAVLTTVVTACGSSSKPASSPSAGSPAHPVNITFWTTNSDPSQGNYLASHFNATHPGIHVSPQYVASSDETTAKEVAAIKTDTEPSVVLGQDPAELPLLAESGKLVPLNGKMDALTNALYPGVKSALFYQGKQLGMALGGTGDYVLFYNKKDFAAAGIATPPATWAEVTADAIKLSNPSANHYGIYIPLGSSEWISYDWEGLLWANGGQFLNQAGTKAAFNSPAGVRALTTWVDLVRKDKAAPQTSFAQAGSYDGAPAFASNAVAMIIEGQFALKTFRTAGIDFGVAPFPKGTAGPATGIGTDVASIFHKSAAEDAAATTFVSWLAQPPQGAYLDSNTSGLPSSPDQSSQPLVKAQAASDPTYSTFAADLQFGRSRPTIPQYSAISMDLSDQINAALTGGVSPTQALDKAASEANALLAGGGGS